MLGSGELDRVWSSPLRGGEPSRILAGGPTILSSPLRGGEPFNSGAAQGVTKSSPLRGGEPAGRLIRTSA